MVVVVVVYRHSFFGLHDQVVVLHRQRDYAAVQVGLVRVAEPVVGRTAVRQRRHRRRVRRVAARRRRRRRRVVRHQHGILRFAGF